MATAQDVRTNEPKHTLYIGDLSPGVTETNLMELFGTNTKVDSLRICRDPNSKRSLQYAYVNFSTRAGAQERMDTLNYTILMGQPMRIMWNEKDKTKRNDTKNNLLLRNIDLTVDSRTLYESFRTFGPIKSLKLVTDSFGKNKGYGYINFETLEDANKAIKLIDGLNFNGKKIKLCFCKPQVEAKYKDKNARNNLYVKNFHPEISVTELQKMFSNYGMLISTFFPRVNENDNSIKGFGFICFENVDQAVNAKEALDGHKITDEKKLYCSYALKKQERLDLLNKQKQEGKKRVADMNKGMNFYLKNFGVDVTETDLIEYFKTFGPIRNCKIQRDASGVSKKFGFLCFIDLESAKKCLQATEHVIKSQKVFVSLHQTKDERRAIFAKEQYRKANQDRGITAHPTSQINNQLAPQYFEPGVTMNLPMQGRSGNIQPVLSHHNPSYQGMQTKHMILNQQMMRQNPGNRSMMSGSGRYLPKTKLVSQYQRGPGGMQMINDQFMHNVTSGGRVNPHQRSVQPGAVVNAVKSEGKMMGSQVAAVAPSQAMNKESISSEVSKNISEHIYKVAESISGGYAGKITSALLRSPHVDKLYADENFLQQEVRKLLAQLQDKSNRVTQ